MKGILWFIGLALVGGLPGPKDLLANPEAGGAGKGQPSIRVLYTSDVIGYLEPCG